MAAGRSTDELFWDNYRDIQIAGQNGAEVDARSRAHTLVVSWPWELLTLTETAPPPPKQFNRSLIALIILLIQISAISSRSWRNAYHELFWHRDLLIFLSYISSHQSVPEMVVGRGGVRGWNLTPAPSPQPPPPSQQIQIIQGTIMSYGHNYELPVCACISSRPPRRKLSQGGGACREMASHNLGHHGFHNNTNHLKRVSSWRQRTDAHHRHLTISILLTSQI